MASRTMVMSLESLPPRVPPVYIAVCDSPVTAENGTATVSSCLAPSSSSLWGLIDRWSFLLFAQLLSTKRERTRAAIVLYQHMRGSDFSRRPQRSGLVGDAKIVGLENFLLVSVFKVVPCRFHMSSFMSDREGVYPQRTT